MLLLAFASILAFTCCAQEHLTCLRSSSPPIGPSITIEDAPRGPVPGKRGPAGPKGEKGEPASGQGNDAEISQLRSQIASLQQQVQDLKGSAGTGIISSSPSPMGFEQLSGGWVGLPNGYQYKRTFRAQNYEESKQACRLMGATLAVYGVQSIDSRRILKRALSLTTATWVGLNSMENRGEWRWENGNPAIAATALWHPNSPNDASRCAEVFFGSHLLGVSYRCSARWFALCEKPLE